jgi:hypothetical protein
VIGLVTLLEKPALATVALTDGLPALMLAATLAVIVTGSLTPAPHAEVSVQVSVEDIAAIQFLRIRHGYRSKPGGKRDRKVDRRVVAAIADAPVLSTVTVTVSPASPPVKG